MAETTAVTTKSNGNKGEEDVQQHLLAVFLASFEIHHGQTIVLQFPTDIDLAGVEYKALASGLHNISEDVIYFKKGPYFGVACYVKQNTNNAAERNARMRSLGVLSPQPDGLHLHVEYLKRQVVKFLEDDTTQAAQELEAYFKLHQERYHMSVPEELDVPSFQINSPLGHLSQFVLFFGPSVFALWRFVLLQCRIMFYCPPPVEVACFRVFCSRFLGAHGIPYVYQIQRNILFYVDLHDFELLEQLDEYIACTTDKIFQIKSQLHDVFVNVRSLETSQRFQGLQHISEADQALTAELRDAIDNASPADREKVVEQFFRELNETVFGVLSNAAASSSPVITESLIRKMRLDPQHDGRFLDLLAATYDIPVRVTEPSVQISLGLCLACCTDNVGYDPL